MKRNKKERREQLEKLSKREETLIFYEAPHRIDKCLEDCLAVFGDRKMTLARELTKLHEEFVRGTISEVLDIIDEVKGEMVIVMDGNHEEPNKAVDMSDVIHMVDDLIEAGMSTRDAIKDIANKTGISKNKIYDAVNNASRS